ncbi:MAG: asparagine synthase (glutamine-hydrolyzing) [Candidatus Aenigmatarchaeota archaeon]
MCGIAGILALNEKGINPYLIKPMCNIISYRGPDDAGYALFSFSKKKNFWLELTDENFKYKNVHLAPIESDYAKKEIEENNWHLVLGHRRLAVIDLTQRAHQPMSDRGKTIWITYNGEIYNFKDLRKELEKVGYVFYSHSDVEVVIYAYQEWGVDFVNKFNGMFAFALWDNEKNKLFLVRDRHGIIPLYYYHKDNILIFASEIKSILESKLIKVEIDYYALNEYFTFQNIFTDRTLFKDVKLLPAGCYLEVDLSKPLPHTISYKRYWDYHFSSENFNLTEDETKEKVYELFKEAVKRQLISDVPLGSYLSGGMDTGSIVSVVKKFFPRLYTFSIGFDTSSASGLELGFDERKYAEILANLLKTEHYECIIHAGDMEAVLPELIWHIEDLRVGQCYPDYYAAKLAGKFVKVVLSGAGGDELFGGYPWRYYRVFNSISKSDYLKRYYDYWQRLIQDSEKKLFFNKETYNKLKDYSTFEVFCSVFNNQSSPKTTEDYINESMYFEIKTFLHGLLIITNKISMAHSLETRVPFLDNDLVDFTMKIPPSMKLKKLDKMIKIDENEPGKLRKYYQKTKDGKIILRKAMQKLIPTEIIEREKQGFSAPDASWFRGESIEYVKSMLLNKKARIYDFLNPSYVRMKIDDHLSGKVNNRLLIWSLLSFEEWIRKFVYSTSQEKKLAKDDI